MDGWSPFKDTCTVGHLIGHNLGSRGYYAAFFDLTLRGSGMASSSTLGVIVACLAAFGTKYGSKSSSLAIFLLLGRASWQTLKEALILSACSGMSHLQV